MNSYPKEKQTRAMELRKQGLTVSKIASLMDIGKSTIHRWVRDITVPRKIKVCSKCNKEDGDVDFYRKGLICKSCYKIYRKVNYAENKDYYKQKARRHSNKIIEHVRSLKSNQPCLDCGKNYHFCAMDFDHVRGNKRFEIARAHLRVTAIQSLEEEISKCDLVCANCHRVRTFNRLQTED